MRLTIFIFTVVFFSQTTLASDGKKKSLTLLGGFPHPVNASFDVRGTKWGFGITGGYSRFAVDYKNTGSYTTQFKNIEMRLRYHPWGGIFFFGVAAGYQELNGVSNRALSVSGITIDSTGNSQLKSFYAIPHVGWFIVAKGGFTIGLEAGAMLPFGAKSSTSITSGNPLLAVATNSDDYKALQSNNQKFSDNFGKSLVPFVTALRLGWSF